MPETSRRNFGRTSADPFAVFWHVHNHILHDLGLETGDRRTDARHRVLATDPVEEMERIDDSLNGDFLRESVAAATHPQPTRPPGAFPIGCDIRSRCEDLVCRLDARFDAHMAWGGQ